MNKNSSLVFCYTVRTMLPLLPLRYLDLGVVGSSEPKVWVYDYFVHLQTEDQMGEKNKGRVR